MNNAIFAARLWAALEGTPMPNRRAMRWITCAQCGREKLHEAKGLCSTCYHAQRAGTPLRGPRPLTDAGRAIGVLLPIPVQAVCAGCPDVPTCRRVAQPRSAYCLRCGQIAAGTVAA